MSKEKKIKVLLSSTLILVFCTNAYGSSANLRARQQEINLQTQVVRESLNSVNIQMTESQQKLLEIENEIRQVVSELDTIDRELNATRQLLEQTAIELEEAEELREEQQERFVQRSRHMYMNGRVSYIDIILNSGSFSDLLRRIDHVNRMVEYDQDLVKQLVETENIIAEKLELTQVQELNLQALEAQQKARRNEYEDIRAQRVAILHALEEEERALMEEMSILEESSKEVENLILAAERAQSSQTTASANRIIDTSNLNGRMAWPVPGRSTISSGYGNRTSPISGRSEFHTGIDIPAPRGTNIIAGDGGRIIYSGWMNGYGNTVIIDHGGGISTLYAHNSRNLVSVGQSVERGQVIGEVGATGFATGNHLHFEVRVNGSHVDPMPYLN